MALLLKILHFLLLSMLLLFGSISPVLGQMMSNIGVTTGDTFKYNYTCYFNTDDSSATPPPDFAWINQTDYYMMKITSISGSTIYYDTTLHMLNGSEVTGTGTMNIGSGTFSMYGYNPIGMNGYYFMSSNVGMMGRMFASSSISPTINNTLMMNYAGRQRTTNHMSLITGQNGVMNQSDYYFDQATGAMVEWQQQTVQTNGNLQTNSTKMMRITSSSIWVVPEFPALMIIPFLSLITTVVLIIRTRKSMVNSK